MKKLLILALGMVFLLGSGGLLSAQPAATGYTLSDIYYYLAEGVEATQGGHSLEPQSGVAGEKIEGFNKSLADIYSFMADAFGQCDLTAADLAGKGLIGKKYFSTDAENWGLVEVVATPTPPPSWYDTYGPDGTGDVIEIEGMYVAMDKDGIGCANDGTKNWTAAVSWGTGLNWLGKTDWELPSKDNLSTICTNKGSLHSFQSLYYWSSTEYDAGYAWLVHFSNCSVPNDNKPNANYVRAVRGGE